MAATKMLQFGWFIFAWILLVEGAIFKFGRRILFPDEIDPSLNSINPPSEVFCHVNGKDGKCVHLKECPELLNFIKFQKRKENFEASKFLKKRICKWELKTVRLCCLVKSSIPLLSTEFVPTNNYSLRPSLLVPSRGQCGVAVVLRIANGEHFNHGTHPWLVGIGFPTNKKSFDVHCGGTLITRKHVLSAAHCFVRKSSSEIPELTHVILGEHSLSKDNERSPPVVRQILAVKHPGYEPYAHSHDISLLLLDKEVPFTTFVRPACLPSLDEVAERNLENKTVIVGWGKINENEEKDLPLETDAVFISKSECKRAYGVDKESFLDGSKICFEGGAKDACQGDSGGPLIFQGSRSFILGVINFGSHCGSSFYPGVFSFVPHYLNWIHRNL